ncbi:MAG: signal recognition particle-docking protein FtsY [Deltaproteobacteria bacterium]|nr:signal recognition particle-docking protein FtsY [Deltaproteobacteria bacterium]MBI3061758.1 signal recognition particle-docking protein FtsY [Deltaproteobacteria bacterium]
MESSSFFQRLKKGMTKTREGWVQKLQGILQGQPWGEQTIESLEEILLSADLGVKATQKLTESLRRTPTDEWGIPRSPLLYLQQEIIRILGETDRKKEAPSRSPSPWVILFLGVNGVGKTTTIGKLAAQYRQSGKKVLLAAADTFRAAAIDQLEVWGQRVEAELVKHKPGADPSAVVFDALHAAKKRQMDVVLIDTAGRLHTKVHLVEELKKIRRVTAKEQEGAPHETLLVLDATTGQNALQQARVFKEAMDITGIVLTKLDGTAKGGVIIGIQEELGVPVQYIGVGEAVEDLQPFDPAEFVKALFEENR